MGTRSNHAHLRFALAAALTCASACSSGSTGTETAPALPPPDAGEPAPARPELTPLDLSPRGLAAYAVLRDTERFTDGAIYDGGDTPVEVVALRHLWEEPAAADAFRVLLVEAGTGGRLFALCGLYYSDPAGFQRAVEPWRASDATVFFQTGCVGLVDMPVRDLVERREVRAVRLERLDQTIEAWAAAHPSQEGAWYDILGGAYPNEFRAEGGYAPVRTLTLEEGAR